MKPTIYDVAKEAGVSIATVSKVLNGVGRISDETIKRVERVMKELQYQPSVVASALTGKQTYTIGMLLPDLANPYFAEVARHVEDRANQLGYSVIICSTDNNVEKESNYISLLNQKSVDGLIIATGIQHEQTSQHIMKQQIPVALFARDFPSLVVDAVLLDDFLGGYQATKHLIDLGHEKIAMIAENEEYLSAQERIRGYCQAMEDAGLSEYTRRKTVYSFTIEGAKQNVIQLLDSIDPPTAIFTTNDILAIGAIQAAYECRISVPDELSIVGFDDTILSRIVTPPLTSVRQPIQEMGMQVMDLLVQEIEQKKRGRRKIVLLPELIIRRSTSNPTRSLRTIREG